MERYTISKSEKQTIYEIYRACRLCGAGGGYRMPIIQNIVDLDASDVELRQKIQDCLQLEVRPDDRMPPLICELCVDKVNDFYKFLELSRHTNIRTRTRLGLPLQTARRGESDPGDCILGFTEPLIKEEPKPKKSTAGPKCSKNIKKEPENIKDKEETIVPSPVLSRSSSVSSRSSRASRRPPTPPRPTRGQVKADTPKVTQVTQEKKKVKEKEVTQKEVREKEVKPKEVKDPRGLVSRKELQSLLLDNQKYDDNSLLVPRSLKRKEEPPKPVVVPKRTRTTPKEPIKEPVKEPTPQPPPRSKPGPKSKKMLQERPPAPKEEAKVIPVPLKIPKSKSKVPVTPPKVEPPPPKVLLSCIICDAHIKTAGALASHLRSHAPNYTKPQNACNPCGKWFVTTEEAASHHRYHRAATFPYHCRRCFDDYRSLQDYDDHIDNGKCMPYNEVPDVKCERCWRTFITQPMMEAHKCQGRDGRPGGNCQNCSRPYASVKTLKIHQRTCTPKKKRDLIADPDVLRRLKPMQVRIARCDDLLAAPVAGRYDVSRVKPNHGLDKNYLYPYIKLKIVKPKQRRRDSTAAPGPIRDKSERDSYTHWDSEDSDSGSVIRKVDSLTTLALKKLFSKNMLGKVPRKKKLEKNEMFDSMNDFGNMSNDINDIISSLNNDLNIRNDCAPRNRKDSLIAIAINDIIGVPNSFVSNDGGLGNENVARNEKSDVHVNDRNRNGNDSAFNGGNENDNIKKDLSDAEIENKGDTVNSVSDISTELNLIESKDTRNEAASEHVDGEITNDSKTQNDNLDTKNSNENVNVSESSEIRNLKSVDGLNDDDNLIQSNDLVVQNDQLDTEGNNESTERNYSEVHNDNIDSKNKNENIDVNNDSKMQNDSNGDEKPNNNSESLNSSINNDNLDTVNNYDRMDINDDSETQNEKHEDTKLNDDSNMQNDDFDTNKSDTAANCDNMEIDNDSETQNANNEDVKLSSESDVQNSNFKINHLDTVNSYEDPELNRIGAETDNFRINEEQLKEKLDLQDSINNLNHFAIETVDLQNSTVNGMHEENNSKTNHDFIESEKSEETSKATKESPIKHSIENLIGDTVKNPDKYIDEVISSIENIIKINEGNKAKENIMNGETNTNQMDDQHLMDALDEQIGEDKDKVDNDKITLDDLLPKEDRSLELDDISDDDFNFDP